jgi:hypothetical protein
MAGVNEKHPNSYYNKTVFALASILQMTSL